MGWIRFAIGLFVLALGVRTASADAPVVLRLGTLAIDGSRYMKDVLALSQELEKRTRGAVRLDWVSDGRLGDERAMADLITAGKLDGGGFSETGLTVLVPDMIVWRAGESSRHLEVTLTSNSAAAVAGRLTIAAPPGWPAPEPRPFSIAKRGERQFLDVALSAPPRLAPGRYAFRAAAILDGGGTVAEAIRAIDYGYIPLTPQPEPADVSL